MTLPTTHSTVHSHKRALARQPRARSLSHSLCAFIYTGNKADDPASVNTFGLRVDHWQPSFAMEAIVTTIQGLSTTSCDLAQLLTFLNSQATVLANQPDAILQAVHCLDASQHSLGMLFLL
jgi:hypothetical protein